ncbi:hypothetical protein FOL47_010941 [Perkinsus chesapeaki]|uniref:Uncharacterized protein n=1 Tax=Perkinsus chesapeaki TaxID=330153 RepID=A0A7J6N2N6_PERCH|nr:hypothetical protein FOL47_010941 [Perkinsus chesapeaki]
MYGGAASERVGPKADVHFIGDSVPRSLSADGLASTTVTPASPTSVPMTSPSNATSTTTSRVSSSSSPVSTSTTPNANVFVCPENYCRDTQFNPPSTTACIYPDPVVLMDCWEKYCDKVKVGSYCLVWEDPSDRMCHGTPKPCYCEDYEVVKGHYVLPSEIPSGWAEARDCDYNGPPSDMPGQPNGGKVQPTTTTPSTSGAMNSVSGGALAVGFAVVAEVSRSN